MPDDEATAVALGGELEVAARLGGRPRIRKGTRQIETHSTRGLKAAAKRRAKNVVWTAKSNGAVRQLVNWLTDAGHECCVDGYVVEEARRNLAVKAPQGMAVLDGLLVIMRVAPAQPGDAALEAALPLPEKDRPVLAAAVRQRCGALVTGDRMHFGRHYGKTVHGVTTHSPRSIAEALL